MRQCNGGGRLSRKGDAELRRNFRGEKNPALGAPLAFQTMIVCQVSRKLEIDIFWYAGTNKYHIRGCFMGIRGCNSNLWVDRKDIDKVQLHSYFLSCKCAQTFNLVLTGGNCNLRKILTTIWVVSTWVRTGRFLYYKYIVVVSSIVDSIIIMLIITRVMMSWSQISHQSYSSFRDIQRTGLILNMIGVAGSLSGN